MALIVALIFGFIIWYLSKSFRGTVENVKYPHKTCPFCGSGVAGHKDYVAINNTSFVNYNCTNCGAYNNASTSIWYRKKGNSSSDIEMRQGN
jgi:ribosomal protein S27AE